MSAVFAALRMNISFRQNKNFFAHLTARHIDLATRCSTRKTASTMAKILYTTIKDDLFHELRTNNRPITMIGQFFQLVIYFCDIPMSLMGHIFVHFYCLSKRTNEVHVWQYFSLLLYYNEL